MIATLRRAIALLLIVIALGVTSCGGDRDVPVVLLAADETTQADNPLTGALSEVSPPERIQQLKPYLDVYAPQVRIASPDPDTTLTKTTVTIRLQVRDFLIYKDQSLDSGPHLHLFLDDQPYQAIYDADAPITLEDLAPGTHTLRLLAVRPWGESFKNEGAYDQITFNVFAASPHNKPDDSRPLLTYNQPQERYGAEPILLDFYLSNAPPHLVAQADETIDDWRIRCTVNGESFVFDRWQSIYLKGFKPGKNWVKLELIDENGNLIGDALNTSIRVIDYQPGGEDSLSKLVRGEIPLAQAKVLIDPDYEPPTLTLEEPIEPIAPASDSESVTVTGETSNTPVTDALTVPDTQSEDTEPPFSVTQAEKTSPAANLDNGTPPSQPAAANTMSGEDEAAAAINSDRLQSIPAVDQPAAMDRASDALEPPASGEDSDALDNTAPTTDMPPEVATEAVLNEDMLESEPREMVEATETLPSADETTSATSSGDQSQIEADDLTDSAPLGAAQETDALPEASLTLEEEQTPAAAIDRWDEPDDTDITAEAEAPQTNLKTLEDNADLI
ncbi:MAG: hypothetical protein F6K00_19315 [Leptolyngbya sp. SIOISBB]|nr:hypothetical protein [Leptolyngbya sp. SIOISBB]